MSGVVCGKALKWGHLPLFLLLCLPAFAQTYPMVHYTKSDGLPSNLVYDVYKDSRGYIWIATDKGIARYNGIAFETFTTGDGLPDNEIFIFQEDYRHRLWMTTFSGALCYYHNGFIHNSHNTPFLWHPTKADVASSIMIEEDSSITVAYRSLDVFVNIKDDSCRVYKKGNATVKDEGLRMAYKLSDSLYRLVYDTKEYVLNVHTGETSVTPTKQNVIYQRGYRYHNSRPYPEPPGYVYETLRRLRNSKTKVYRIYSEGNKYLMATENGLYVTQTGMLLKGRHVPSVTRDMAGDYWVATLGDGIYRMGNDFKKSGYIAQAYSGTVTYALYHAGTAYFATSEGHLYEMVGGKAKKRLDFSEGTEKRRGKVNCSHNGHTVYCPGHKGTVFAYDLAQHKTARVPLPDALRRDSEKGGEWKSIVATDSGLCFVCITLIARVSTAYGGSGKPAYRCMGTPDRIYASASDGKGTLFYSREDGIHTAWGRNPAWPARFGTRLFTWLVYHHHTLIGCTPTNGLYLFRAGGGKVHTDSLLLDHIVWNRAYPLFADELLLASDKGYYTLSLADVRKNGVAPRPVENPFLPADAEYVLGNGDGCLFFKNGNITLMDRAGLAKPAPMPAIYFGDMLLGDSLYRFGTDNPKPVRVAYSREAVTARITFERIAHNARDVTYEYRLALDNGKPSAWETLTDAELQLLLPRYGTVNLFVRASTHAGQSSPPKRLTIVLAKPWWASTWGSTALVLATLTAVGLSAYLVTRAAMRRRERELRAKIRVLNAEFKSLNAMMNPHFIFNTLNNLQGFINADDTPRANEYIRKFSDMVRQNMVNLSKEMVTLADELMVVERYLELQCLRFRNITYHIDVDESVDPDDIMLPPLLLQPLVENSIRHGILPLAGKQGHIRIKITETGGAVRIEITDNGIGVSRAKKRGGSFALDALRQRADAVSITHHVDISFEIRDLTGPHGPGGTLVVLSIIDRS